MSATETEITQLRAAMTAIEAQRPLLGNSVVDAALAPMREKLAASNEVLEGLAIEDFNLILQGANKLAKISDAEEWQVSTDSMYRQHSNEFGRAVKQLQTAAKDRKLDAAALAWLDATMDCIECHRWVRATLIAN